MPTGASAMFQSQPKSHCGLRSMLPFGIGQLPACQGTGNGCAAWIASAVRVAERRVISMRFSPGTRASATGTASSRNMVAWAVTKWPFRRISATVSSMSATRSQGPSPGSRVKLRE